MITQVKEGLEYIHIAVAIIDGDGKACDPSNAEAWFYKVSQADGTISLDANINGTGKVTLAKQGGQTGFYGGAVAIASLSANEYVILYKVTVESIESITVEFFSIDIAKKLIPLIKTEADKIQPEILDKKGEFKADVSGLAPKDEYDAELAAIQNDLDNPDQFKADTAALALEASVQAVKGIAEFLESIEGGRWKIETNQMIFYKPDNVTEIARFNLFDKDGVPAMENVLERKRT